MANWIWQMTHGGRGQEFLAKVNKLLYPSCVHPSCFYLNSVAFLVPPSTFLPSSWLPGGPSFFFFLPGAFDSNSGVWQEIRKKAKVIAEDPFSATWRVLGSFLEGRPIFGCLAGAYRDEQMNSLDGHFPDPKWLANEKLVGGGSHQPVVTDQGLGGPPIGSSIV